jgi:hypothetical protein
MDKLIRRSEIDKLIQMLRSTYFVLLDGENTYVDVGALIGNLAEFLALWDGDKGAFRMEGDDLADAFHLINLMRGDIEKLCEMLTDAGINPPTSVLDTIKHAMLWAQKGVE